MPTYTLYIEQLLIEGGDFEIEADTLEEALQYGNSQIWANDASWHRTDPVAYRTRALELGPVFLSVTDLMEHPKLVNPTYAIEFPNLEENLRVFKPAWHALVKEAARDQLAAEEPMPTSPPDAPKKAAKKRASRKS